MVSLDATSSQFRAELLVCDPVLLCLFHFFLCA
jgi:hypothetical protein